MKGERAAHLLRRLADAPKQAEFRSSRTCQVERHFDSLEPILSASCESDVSSSAHCSIAFAVKRLWCSTTCSGLRQARSADQAAIVSRGEARDLIGARLHSLKPLLERTLVGVRQVRHRRRPSCRLRCLALLRRTRGVGTADPPVTQRETTRELSRMRSGHVHYFFSTDLMTKSYRCERSHRDGSMAIDSMRRDACLAGSSRAAPQLAMLTTYQIDIICVSKQRRTLSLR